MRIMLSGIIIALFVTSALAAGAMSGKELTALLGNGKTLMLGGPGAGYKGELTLTKDGKGMGQVTLDNGQVIKIQGSWKIKGKKFCRTWIGGRDAGKQVCETWVKTGDKSVKVMVGKKDIGTNSWN